MLAESYEANATATEYVIHLRHGVSFSDGAPFDADRGEDLVRPRPRSGQPPQARQPVRADRPHRRGRRFTVKIVLKYPFGAFINNLAHAAYAIMSPKAIAQYGKDVDRHPSGTGPYMFSSWQPDTLKVVKNPNYWKPGMPKVDSITIRIVPEAAAGWPCCRPARRSYIFPLPVEMATAIETQPDAGRDRRQVDLSPATSR